MKIKYTNSENTYDIFYKIFLQVMELDYTPKKIDSIDKMIAKDTLELVDRIVTSKCKKMLGRIGVKGYYKLNMVDTKKLLNIELGKKNEELILEFYKDNKVVLDMFKYEVIETLNISKYEFDKIRGNLKVSGKQIINIGKIPKTVIKYDRRSVYKLIIREI
ncbi:MAG: hypothetical protein ACRCW0_08940 [Clostridium sp.]